MGVLQGLGHAWYGVCTRAGGAGISKQNGPPWKLFVISMFVLQYVFLGRGWLGSGGGGQALVTVPVELNMFNIHSCNVGDCCTVAMLRGRPEASKQRTGVVCASDPRWLWGHVAWLDAPGNAYKAT